MADSLNIGQKCESKQIDEIIDEANKIWKEVKSANIDVADEKHVTSFIIFLVKIIRISNLHYLLFFKLWFYTKDYNSKVLGRYLKKLQLT